VRFDRAAYRRRNVIERTINRLKAFRGIAARSDKLACRYHAAVTLAIIVLFWLEEDRVANTPKESGVELWNSIAGGSGSDALECSSFPFPGSYMPSPDASPYLAPSWASTR
jgi:hypothetical protein